MTGNGSDDCLGPLAQTQVFNRSLRAKGTPGSVGGTLVEVVRGGWGGENISLTQHLGLLSPRLWKQQRSGFLGVSRLEVVQVHLIRRQQGGAPGDRGLVMAMTTNCGLNSN